MSTPGNHLQAPTNDERSVTAPEHGRTAGRIAVVIVTSIATLGSKLSGTFISIAAALP
jgi:Flp pilus assembly pilin Flp